MEQFDVEKIVSLLAKGGVFEGKGFEVRQQQVAMLRDCLSTYLENKTAAIEAATGTGKSIAYLLAAVFWALKKGQRTVVSTNTIALQEQLLKKDIPFLLQTIGQNVKVVLVKGMHNYLCLRKLDDANVEKRFFNEKQIAELEKIELFAKKESDGSKSSLGFTPSHEVWEKVAAEGESCTHIKCPHYKKCFFFKARSEAADAQLLVSNHHLLFADISLRFETDNYDQSCILPSFTRLILDEAHHVEEVAKEHFAKKVSFGVFLRFLNRLVAERSGGKIKALHQKIFETVPPEKRDKELDKLLLELELDIPITKKKCLEQIEETFSAFKDFEGEEKMRIRPEHLTHPFWTDIFQKKVNDTTFLLKSLLQSIESALQRIENNEILKAKCEGIMADIKGIILRLEGFLQTLMEFAFSPENKEEVKWIELPTKTLVIAKIDVSSLLNDALFSKMDSTVLCSATLSSKKDFSFIKRSLGLKEMYEKIYDSPFDYEKKAVLLVPLDMPHPDADFFAKAASAKIEEAVIASSGGTFVLFTSYSALMLAKEQLEASFYQKKFTLLCQGQRPTHELLNEFKKNQRAVLFGTDSFWEGVDVSGDALRCVIIMKLPFLVPSDPFFQAKSERMKENGQSPFFDYSLPQATMKFKQGFGRLIRTKTDRGCVMCLDHRLATKGYGKIFLNTLPNCPRVFDKGEKVIEKLREFFKKEQGEDVGSCKFHTAH